MSKKNVLVAQSGGPTVAINASLAGVISGVLKHDSWDTVYGSLYGILGILNDQLINLSQQADRLPDFISTLKVSPAMYLGSCRYKLPDYQKDDADYAFIFNQFKKYNIGAFFYIGGNDSMDTVLKLSHYGEQIGSDIRIIGIPKTIDNDLCLTDHTPGYGSAAKYIASSILEIAHDTFIYSAKSVTIVEIMGRDAGWLTASAALARNAYNSAPHLIYLPEVAFDKARFIREVNTELARRNNVIIAVSEGIRDNEGNYFSASTATNDQFGHSQLSGTGKCLEYFIKESINVKVRSIEVNVLQRCAAHLSSLTDLEEAFSMGENAVSFAAEGMSKCMLTLTRTSNSPYRVSIGTADIGQVANKAKSIPQEWINEAGSDVTPALIDYIKPLIIGEPVISYKDGLPVYLPVEHLNTGR
ncbi:MAG: 6-phosphofructokinase [Bacteroidales bacterium]|nr:6-phosphofructokinase [Clostridium sp.]MCM1204068.1 6-phosphofructokinase [Bacteroidales bacterium]